MPAEILTLDRSVIPITTGRPKPSRRPGGGNPGWPPRADPRTAAPGGEWAPDWRSWGRIDGWPFEYAVSHVAPPVAERPDWTLSPTGVWIGFRPV